MNEAGPQRWDIWHARFNYEGGKGYKFRPVIIVDATADDTLVMMVTSAMNKLHMEHDYHLANWKEAGLVKPSIARIDRIAAIPADYFGTAGRIGRLSESDIAAISKLLLQAAKRQGREP